MNQEKNWFPFLSCLFFKLKYHYMEHSSLDVLLNSRFVLYTRKSVNTGLKQHDGEKIMTEFSFLDQFF